MYCNYLLTTNVTALQVVRTSFQHSFFSGLPRQSLLLFLTSHGIDPEYMSMIINVQPEGVKPSPLWDCKNRLFVTGTRNYRQQMGLKNWSV